MASPGERGLAAEWLVIMFVQTADALSGGPQGQGGGPKLPAPKRFFATMIVFMFLAILAATGEAQAKLARTFGGVAMLAIALAPNTATGRSPVVGFFSWLSAMVSGGPITQLGQVQTPKVTQPNPAGIGAGTQGPGGGVLGPGVINGSIGGPTQLLTPAQQAQGKGLA